MKGITIFGWLTVLMPFFLLLGEFSGARRPVPPSKILALGVGAAVMLIVGVGLHQGSPDSVPHMHVSSIFHASGRADLPQDAPSGIADTRRFAPVWCFLFLLFHAPNCQGSFSNGSALIDCDTLLESLELSIQS